MDLFSASAEQETAIKAPLAVRMRPRTLDEFVGQEDVVGPGRFLRRMLESDNLCSIILFGPPGTGKTTLAQIIANTTGAWFERLNAVSAGIADIRRAVEGARERWKFYRRRTVVFIDEIHRFNKAQQDALLPHVEDGTITLIGATTENPYFEMNSPLLSRIRIIRLSPLKMEDILALLRRAIADSERGLGKLDLAIDPDSLETIAMLANGDARVALNILEQAAAGPGSRLDKEAVFKVTGQRVQLYDKQGDQHYDIISAFIKSMRGSDPDAAVHYLARMIEAGEDPEFIARRIVICAAEDVGNADPLALVVASAAVDAVRFVGMPEARIPLAQAAIYVAAAPKSNAAYLAIERALDDVRHQNCGQVPVHLRDANYAGAQKFGHGQGYKYPHDFPGGYVAQEYLPEELRGVKYYHPTERGREKELAARLNALRASKAKE